MSSESFQSGLIGRSDAIKTVLDRVDVFAGSDAPVLITGESGTGKELVARALHDRSSRASGPFIAVNCAAFPEALLEAELFGHERGAFTGAIRKRDGRFKAADGGTLFLDEVAEIPLASQAKLLRVLQDGTFEPLGTNETVTVNVRLLSATHRNLKELVSHRRFREDLYYRLKILELGVPTLRDRREDLPLLVEHFLRLHAPPGDPRLLTEAAMTTLAAYRFPGNVRELQHAIQHAIALSSREESIDARHLPPDIVSFAAATAPAIPEMRALHDALHAFEREYLALALARTGGKKLRAAELLGISRKSLWEKLRRHALVETTSEMELATDENEIFLPPGAGDPPVVRPPR